MTTPRVTVGISFFDEERYLADAVRSILNQTFDDFELLLVDDGSRDRSLDIARSFDDPRVRVFSDGQRRHLAARLNEITRRARAPLVARMDADDVSHSDRLRSEIEILDRDPRCDAVGTWAILVDADENPVGVAEGIGSPIPRDAPLGRGIFPHATMVARREWLLDNPYDETIFRAEDRELFCRTHASEFRVVPRCLYVIRVVPDGDFREAYRQAHRDFRRVILRYGRRSVGLGRTARLYAVSCAKSATMAVLTRVGLCPWAVRRRGRAPLPDERRDAAGALSAAQQP